MASVIVRLNNYFIEFSGAVMRHSRVKLVIACWIFLVPAASATSDYGPMTLFQLLTANEIAVRGDVRNVEGAL